MSDRHYQVVLFESGEDLDLIAFDKAQLHGDPADFAFNDEEYIVFIGFEYQGFLGNGQGLGPSFGDDAYGGEHSRFEQAVGVDFKRGFHRAALRVDLRANHADFAVETAFGQRFDGDGGLLAGM